MTMAARLQGFLQQNQSKYDLVRHTHSQTSREAARRAGISPERIAKPVILGDSQGNYLMAVVPASRQLSLNKIRQATHGNWHLAGEKEFQNRFSDCESGAIPPIGSAYGMDTVIDAELASQKDIYFEAGDHEALVHMGTDQFLKLMPKAQKTTICE